MALGINTQYLSSTQESSLTIEHTPSSGRFTNATYSRSFLNVTLFVLSMLSCIPGTLGAQSTTTIPPETRGKFPNNFNVPVGKEASLPFGKDEMNPGYSNDCRFSTADQTPLPSYYDTSGQDMCMLKVTLPTETTEYVKVYSDDPTAEKAEHRIGIYGVNPNTYAPKNENGLGVVPIKHEQIVKNKITACTVPEPRDSMELNGLELTYNISCDNPRVQATIDHPEYQVKASSNVKDDFSCTIFCINDYGAVPCNIQFNLDNDQEISQKNNKKNYALNLAGTITGTFTGIIALLCQAEKIIDNVKKISKRYCPSKIQTSTSDIEVPLLQDDAKENSL